MTAPERAQCGDPVRELLPWAATARLSAEDAARVNEHLRYCASCRAWLEFDQALATRFVAADNVEYAPTASLRRFMARLDADPGPVVAATSRLPVRRGPKFRRILLATLAAQAAALLVLVGAFVARPARDEPYVTLARPAPVPDRPALRVVFASELRIGEVGALLGRIGADVADGPSEAGVYTLTLEPGHRIDDALAVLRADPRVRFAEPVTESDVRR